MVATTDTDMVLAHALRVSRASFTCLSDLVVEWRRLADDAVITFDTLRNVTDRVLELSALPLPPPPSASSFAAPSLLPSGAHIGRNCRVVTGSDLRALAVQSRWGVVGETRNAPSTLVDRHRVSCENLMVSIRQNASECEVVVATMNNVVRDVTAACDKATKVCGIAHVLERTDVSPALADYAEWATNIQHTFAASLQRKHHALSKLSYANLDQVPDISNAYSNIEDPHGDTWSLTRVNDAIVHALCHT